MNLQSIGFEFSSQYDTPLSGASHLNAFDSQVPHYGDTGPTPTETQAEPITAPTELKQQIHDFFSKELALNNSGLDGQPLDETAESDALTLGGAQSSEHSNLDNVNDFLKASDFDTLIHDMSEGNMKFNREKGCLEWNADISLGLGHTERAQGDEVTETDFKWLTRNAGQYVDQSLAAPLLFVQDKAAIQ